VDIFIDEHEDERITHAEARLRTNDRTHLVGRGTAHRHRTTRRSPRSADELAAARALSNLSHELIHAAATDIEQITKKHVHLRG